MTSPQHRPVPIETDEPLELTEAVLPGEVEDDRWQIAPEAELEEPGADGRRVLAVALISLAVLWVGFTAWSSGRALNAGLTAAGVVQWIAIAAGPLALLALAWLVFGRTRRRETERFTHSVRVMRAEARGLTELLGVLRQRLDEEQAALASHGERLMRLGDEASHRLGAVARSLDERSEILARHTSALDRAAESARTDIGVLLDDLPRAEQSSRAMAEALRSSGLESSAQAASLEAQLAAITGRAREAEDVVGGAAQRLVAHLTQIESAGAAAATRVGDVATEASSEVDALLARMAEALGTVRSGIDVQSQAVRALVDQSRAAMGQAGIETADQLGQRLQACQGMIGGLSQRIVEQDRAATALVAGLDRQLADLDQRFVDLAAEGDMRANAVAGAIGRMRRELEDLAVQGTASDGSLEQLAARTEQLRQSVAALQREFGDGLLGAMEGAESGTERLLAAVQSARPELSWMQEAATEASARIAASAENLGGQRRDLEGLLGTIETGVGTAEERLAGLRQVIADTSNDAARIEAEVGPALVQALVQVREAAAQAALRAREALDAVIPDAADRLSEETRNAVSRAVEDSVAGELLRVQQVAATALAAARTASEGLSRQMLNIGKTATALEHHMVRTEEDKRASESEEFARRSSAVLDSLHSVGIDVGRMLSDEVDDRAWAAYLKGDRGIFTRKAVRLLSARDERAIAQRMDQDGEFADSVTRFVHDFESMLRRVSGDREGGMMAVTLLGSDLGKLYAALSQVVERRR